MVDFLLQFVIDQWLIRIIWSLLFSTLFLKLMLFNSHFISVSRESTKYLLKSINFLYTRSLKTIDKSKQLHKLAKVYEVETF
jgi:hypothetical protein